MMNFIFFAFSDLLKQVYVYFIVDHDDTADSTEHTGQAHPDQTEATHQSENC